VENFQKKQELEITFEVLTALMIEEQQEPPTRWHHNPEDHNRQKNFCGDENDS
jgi:hypothetical protein